MLKLVWYVLYWYSLEWLLYYIQCTLIQYVNIDLKCYFRYVSYAIYIQFEENSHTGGHHSYGQNDWKITEKKNKQKEVPLVMCFRNVVVVRCYRFTLKSDAPPAGAPRDCRRCWSFVFTSPCSPPHPRLRPIPSRRIVRNFTVKQEILSG